MPVIAISCDGKSPEGYAWLGSEAKSKPNTVLFRYSDITPTEALQNARKGKYSQRQQLAEAIKVAEALTKVDAGPRLRAWGASGGVESNSPDGSAEGWFRESWATSERSRERFSITGPRADETERFLAYLSTTLPASSPQASELADAPKATRPPAVPTQAKGPKMAHPPAWYQPLEALSSDFCSLGRVRRLIEEVAPDPTYLFFFSLSLTAQNCFSRLSLMWWAARKAGSLSASSRAA